MIAFLSSMFAFLQLVQSLRVVLQQGVQPSWFTLAVEGDLQRTPSRGGDLRHHLLTPQNPIMGETVFAEVLLKVLEPYRKVGKAIELIIICMNSLAWKLGNAMLVSWAEPCVQFGRSFVG